VHASQFQLGMIYFGVFGSTTGLLYLEISDLGALPMSAILAIGLIAAVCAVIQWRRRTRYVDTGLIGVGATGNGAGDRPAAAARFLSRFQKVFNAVIGAAAITLMIMAIAFAGLELAFEPRWAVDPADFVPSPASPSVAAMTLISLILLPLLRPLVDIVNWQRLAAFANQSNARSAAPSGWIKALGQFCTAYAVEVPLVGLLICLFGALAGLSFVAPTRAELIPFIISQLARENEAITSAIVALFVLAAAAMAVATLASLFSAGLCAIGYDIAPLFRTLPSRDKAASPSDRALPRWLAALLVALATLAVFYIAAAYFDVAFASPRFLGLVLCCSSIQLVFAPLVLAPLVGRADVIAALRPGWTLAVLLVGAVLGLIVTARALLGGDESLLLWIVPAFLGSAAGVFALAVVMRRPSSPQLK